MIPTAVPWGYFYSNIIVCFVTKYDANLECLGKFYFINLSIHQDPKITGEYRSKYKILRASRFDGGLRTK